MALKTQFPLFAPPQVLPQPHRSATEVRFSRWNNANAQKFIRRERSQKELEDQLRLEKRFDSAKTIAHNYNPAPPHLTSFKSTGTPSAPSSPSIPGKASKYSKQPSSHPAFKPLTKPRNIRIKGEEVLPEKPDFRIDENGISYEMPDAPFVYQYSYTETPKAKPVKLREPLVSPFGPETMAKPWLGRRPLPPSKKKLPEFDSFKLPPPHKKGVKPVQAPGPYLPGSGPKYVMSREEVLGEPLTKEEVETLIESSRKSSRQLNMGRDGLTHNMLDNIHALWKRRRVCKIKCKGVCTVDMENVCQQLEEKAGGKIVYNKGGVIYLFRGRNYNHRSRPRFPLMLWKPATPVYPRLVQRVPDGLTLEEASNMRRKGRELTPICKLAKNGVYCDLVKNVREAFEACELVRIDCQGLNPSDYRRIAAKLKDLVPCVLISFEREHILIWRGPHWKSSIEPTTSLRCLEEVKTDGASGLSAAPSTSTLNSTVNEETHNGLDKTLSSTYSNEKSQGDSVLTEAATDDTTSFSPDISVVASHQVPADNNNNIEKSVTSLATPCSVDDRSETKELLQTTASKIEFDGSVETQNAVGNTYSITAVSELSSAVELHTHEQVNNKESSNEQMSQNVSCTEEIMLLRKNALENGMAIVLDQDSLDADIVFKKAVAFAKTAQMSPRFPLRSKQLGVEEKKQQEGDDSRAKEAPAGIPTEITMTGRSSRRDSRKSSSTSKKLEDIRGDYLNVVPQGSLRVDELAKLLS